MNLERALYNGSYEADSISVDSFELAINNDHKPPVDLNRRPRLPHQLLAETSFPMNVRKIGLRNGTLRYVERTDG